MAFRPKDYAIMVIVGMTASALLDGRSVQVEPLFGAQDAFPGLPLCLAGQDIEPSRE